MVGQAKKIKNSDNLPEKSLWGLWSYDRWGFGSQPSAVIARVLNKNAIWWQTRDNRKLPKHKLSQNVCIRLSLCFALPAWSAGMLFYKAKWKLSLISGYIFSKTIDSWKSKIFFEDSSPKRFFWQIVRIFDFFSLASDSWYLQSWALKWFVI